MQGIVLSAIGRALTQLQQGLASFPLGFAWTLQMTKIGHDAKLRKDGHKTIIAADYSAVYVHTHAQGRHRESVIQIGQQRTQ